MAAPLALFVFVPGTPLAAWQEFCTFFCFDSLTLQIIFHINDIIDVIKYGVQHFFSK